VFRDIGFEKRKGKVARIYSKSGGKASLSVLARCQGKKEGGKKRSLNSAMTVSGKVQRIFAGPGLKGKGTRQQISAGEKEKKGLAFRVMAKREKRGKHISGTPARDKGQKGDFASAGEGGREKGAAMMASHYGGRRENPRGYGLFARKKEKGESATL